MSRAALLAAIKAKPEEDLPRLLYADYLEECGGGDLNRATVEFIRLSCDMKEGGRHSSAMMPRAVYPWLVNNKFRLIPSVVAMSRTREGERRNSLGGRMNGRYLKGYIRVDHHGRKNLTRVFSLTLEFHRGFVVEVPYCCNTLWAEIGDALLADQPLCGRPGNIWFGDE